MKEVFDIFLATKDIVELLAFSVTLNPHKWHIIESEHSQVHTLQPLCACIFCLNGFTFNLLCHLALFTLLLCYIFICIIFICASYFEWIFFTSNNCLILSRLNRDRYMYKHITLVYLLSVDIKHFFAKYKF